MSFSGDERRLHRKAILDALYEETNSNGGDPHKDEVETFRDNPLGASSESFAYCGELKLNFWYIDPDKPNNNEKAALWSAINSNVNNLCKHKLNPSVNHDEVLPVDDPGGWDGQTKINLLQQIFEYEIEQNIQGDD